MNKLNQIKRAIKDNTNYTYYTSEYGILLKKIREINYFKQGNSNWFGSNINEKAKEIKRILKNFRLAMQNGEIIHVQNTGSEFLRYKVDGEYKYSYIGTGYESDWKDQDGVIVEKDGEYPDCVGGLSVSNLYVQPNKDVLNPLDEFESWENDWEIISENSFRYKNAR